MFDAFIWDMGGHDENVQQILSKLPHARIIRYLGSHLDMMRRTATRSRTEYFWVVSSCCDYDGFDFRWMPPLGQERQLHCWATSREKFGDTFLVHLPSWVEQQQVEKLEWYQHVNYHANGVAALPWPRAETIGNDLAKSVKACTSNSLYSTYIMDGSEAVPAVGFDKWYNKHIIAFNDTGHVSICPRDAKAALKTQIFDWPYIKYVNDPNIAKNPQDVVFISYDEENAESNWQVLKQACPRAKRVTGVHGIMAALKKAAMISSTGYFYAVFGKTKLDPSFRFDHHPDYLRRPANYIFYAYNPILDHSYGHGGIVMHDRQWLLDNDSFDLDITMSHHTVIIPEISCRLEMVDAWSAWRTAFREAYKLRTLLDRRYNLDDEYHLHLWLNRDNTPLGRHSKQGAMAGSAFYESNPGAHDLVNDWAHLKRLFQELDHA